MSVIRDAVSLLLAIIASLAFVLYTTGQWTRTTVVSESGFMQVVGPMSSDAELQQEFAKSALDDVLPDFPVPDWAREKVEDLLTSQVHVVTDSPAYGEIWNASMRDMHTQLVQGGTVEFTADLGPAWDYLAQPIDDLLPFGWELPVPDSTVIPLATFDGTWFTNLVLLADSTGLFLAVAIGAALACVLLARHRVFAVGALGVSVLAGGFALWFALVNRAALIPSHIAEEKFLGPVLMAFAERAFTDLTPATLVLMGAGAGLLVLAIIASVVLGALRIRREKAAGVERPVGDRGIRYDAYDL